MQVGKDIQKDAFDMNSLFGGDDDSVVMCSKEGAASITGRADLKPP